MFSDNLLDHIQEVKQTSIVVDLSNLSVVLQNLKFVHDACVASEQLLIDAASQILIESDSGVKLKDYYERHLEEERGEIALLKEDLKDSDVDLVFADPTAMAMVGTQYYLIKHQHPISLLGYMAVTEADPTPLAVVESLEKLHGEKLFRFVRLHAIKDLEHRKELLEIIDSSPKSLLHFISLSTENVLGYLAEAALKWQDQQTAI